MIKCTLKSTIFVTLTIGKRGEYYTQMSLYTIKIDKKSLLTQYFSYFQGPNGCRRFFFSNSRFYAVSRKFSIFSFFRFVSFVTHRNCRLNRKLLIIIIIIIIIRGSEYNTYHIGLKVASIWESTIFFFLYGRLNRYVLCVQTFLVNHFILFFFVILAHLKLFKNSLILAIGTFVLAGIFRVDCFSFEDKKRGSNSHKLINFRLQFFICYVYTSLCKGMY